MGVYLSRPNTEKASLDGDFDADGVGERLPFAVSEMQGWRKSMEDAHISEARAAPGLSVFAVFDGHGGKEVAAFCANHFVEQLVASEAYRSGDVGEALRACFHRMDDMLRDARNAAELSALRDRDDAITASLDRTDSDDEEESSAATGEDGELSAVDAAAARAEGEAGAVRASAVTALPRTAQESKEQLKAEVKQRMSEAEQKGSLSKSEALQLVMNMMRLKKLDEDDSGNGSSGSAGRSAGAGAKAGASGVAVGPAYTEAGCTAIVCALRDRVLYVANAGDSRAVLCSAGRAKPLSQDHKPQQPGELARITRAGGTVSDAGRVNGNLNLSRSIGDLRYKVDVARPPQEQVITAEPDVRAVPLSDDDEYLFIACDGVFDVMTNDDAVAFINRRLALGVTPVSTVLEQVFEECMCDSPTASGGIGADNMTACIVLLKPLSYFVRGDAQEERGARNEGKASAASGKARSKK